MRRTNRNIGSLFWPTAGTLNGRVLTEVDNKYYQPILVSKDCKQAQANVDYLMALRKATDPNSGDVALAYCYAYEATWPKLQAWIAAYCTPTDVLTQSPGINTNVTPSPGTDTTQPAQSNAGLLLAGLFLAGGIYFANKKNRRKKSSK